MPLFVCTYFNAFFVSFRRLDYHLVSEKLKDKICESVIRKDVMGSDHCPVTLFMAM